MRHVFLLILLWATACAPVVRPMGPAVGDPFVSSDALTARDGVTLPLKSWLPGGKPRAVIVGLHGFNDYSNALALPAAYWADRDIATYAYDQRGFGGAPNRGYWAGTRAMAADLRAAVIAVKQRHPGVPVHVVGVSMGGAVTMAALSRGPIKGIESAVLVAPAVWGRAHMNVFQRGALWLLSNTMPWFPLTGEGLNVTPSDNIPMLRALSRDSKIIHETRVDAVKGLVDLMDSAYGAAPSLNGTPILITYGLKDEIVPRAPTQDVMRRLPRTNGNRLALYEGGYHMMLRDTQAEILWNDIAAWILDRGAPLPSGADRRAEALLARNQ
ncbi:MAG: alpha/beta hydrolase [Rhodospirillaceae bacterium]|jgi:alpha-beta hydrolase superfamily lysophospholipase|nr:alpha/beta hydrolase [Rhodospirillaceae bacterium]MBT7756024.1 alpha/beta hydrolase [Rhodospirillaceae bacterium]